MSLFSIVYFPYGATSYPYSPQIPHRGNDYRANQGDPIVVAGTQIGLVGSTGMADGPHTHVQAGRDEWAQKTIDPTPYVNKAGTVVKVGEASQWGKYVCLRVGDVNVFYCHMSRQDVAVGQEIKGDDMTISEEVAKKLYPLFLHRQPENDKAWQYWVGREMEEWMNQLTKPGSEWHGQNDALIRAYPAVVAENKTLKDELVSGDVDSSKKLQKIREIVK